MICAYVITILHVVTQATSFQVPSVSQNAIPLLSKRLHVFSNIMPSGKIFNMSKFIGDTVSSGGTTGNSLNVLPATNEERDFLPAHYLLEIDNGTELIRSAHSFPFEGTIASIFSTVHRTMKSATKDLKGSILNKGTASKCVTYRSEPGDGTLRVYRFSLRDRYDEEYFNGMCLPLGRKIKPWDTLVIGAEMGVDEFTEK